MRKRERRKRGREGEHPRSLEKKSERERPHPTFSTIFVSLLEVGKWFEERKRRGRGRKRLFLTRVLRVLFFRKWGPELNFKREREREGRSVDRRGFRTCPAWTISRGKSGKTSGTGTSRHGGVASPEKSYRIRMPKEVVWLSVYICMYIYIRSPVPRARREEREKVGSSLFHRLPRKITTRNLDLPSLPAPISH